MPFVMRPQTEGRASAARASVSSRVRDDPRRHRRAADSRPPRVADEVEEDGQTPWVGQVSKIAPKRCWLGRRGRGRPRQRGASRTPDCERLAGVRIPSIGGTGPLEARESTGLRISPPPPVVESIKLFSVTR